MKLNEFFESHYQPLKLRDGSIETVRLYGCTIRAFGKWLASAAGDEKGYIEPTLDHLDDMTVSRFLAKRASTRSKFTSEKERGQLLALWRLACDRGIKAIRPCVPPTNLPERVPRAWTVEELQRIVSAARKMKGYVGDVPANVFWPALILTCYQSAERIGAVMAVRKSDYSRPFIHMRAEVRKARKRDKVYRFTDPVCDLLDQLMRTRGEKLFEWKGPFTYLWGRFGAVIQAAGLPCGRRDKFHKLRRSAATHFAARGHDATAMLDHSSPRITKQYYLDPTMIQSGPNPADVLPDIGMNST